MSERKPRPNVVGVWLVIIALALVLGGPRNAVNAQSASAAVSVPLSYGGGPLIPNVKVVTIFWGWAGIGPSHGRGPSIVSSGIRYFNGLFQSLFADGRYMANLSQYSVGAYTIGNGELAGTATENIRPPGSTVSDSQIVGEIVGKIQQGAVPRPDKNTLYIVFTPPGMDVIDPSGRSSFHRFFGYHFFRRASGGDLVYAVIVYRPDAGAMSGTCTHELAEAVTDVEPQHGWFLADPSSRLNGAEIADIVEALYGGPVYDMLPSIDGGATYLVQKVWSQRDSAAVAFAH